MDAWILLGHLCKKDCDMCGTLRDALGLGMMQAEVRPLAGQKGLLCGVDTNAGAKAGSHQKTGVGVPCSCRSATTIALLHKTCTSSAFYRASSMATEARGWP